MKETWVQPMGWEDPSEQEMATHFTILIGKIPWTEGLVDYSPSHGHKEIDMTKNQLALTTPSSSNKEMS